MEQQIFDIFFQKETIFLALFLFLFWEQRREFKIAVQKAEAQNEKNEAFIEKQQELLASLTRSVESIDEDLKEIKNQIKGAA